jgi:hypothetical protein
MCLLQNAKPYPHRIWKMMIATWRNALGATVTSWNITVLANCATGALVSDLEDSDFFDGPAV